MPPGNEGSYERRRGYRALAGASAVARGRPARTRARGPVAAVGEPEAANRTRRARRPVDLPLLRGRLRPADLRRERRGLAYRGRSGEPDLARTALPEGPGVEVVRGEPAARIQGEVPPALRHALGGALARRGDGDDRPAGNRAPRRQLAGGDGGRQAGKPDDGDREPRRRDARQRRELPDQEALRRPRHRPGREP